MSFLDVFKANTYKQECERLQSELDRLKSTCSGRAIQRILKN